MRAPCFPMPHTRRAELGELALTTTLLSIYYGARGTVRALGAAQTALAGLERARGRPARGTGRLTRA